jgi:hypothetical protein
MPSVYFISLSAFFYLIQQKQTHYNQRIHFYLDLTVKLILLYAFLHLKLKFLNILDVNFLISISKAIFIINFTKHMFYTKIL